MAATVIFASDDATVDREGERFFITYDAGAHVPQMRRDEISAADAAAIVADPAAIERVLWAVQRRLQAAGIDPYRANTGPV